MTKVLKNFYLRSLLQALIVFFVFYFIFGAALTAFVPAHEAHVAAVKKAAADAKLAALTGADSLTDPDDITIVYGASRAALTSNGGYIIVTEAEGAEGPIVLTTGLDADGAVTGILVTEAEEDPRYGGKALQDDYLSKYIGVTDPATVDAFTGATYTTAAIKSCIETAELQYRVINGEEYTRPLFGEELEEFLRCECLGEGYVREEGVELADTVLEVCTSEKGMSVLTEAKGVEGPIRLFIYMDEKGVVREVRTISHSEPVGRGDQYLTDSYMFFYEGFSNYGVFDDGSGVYVLTKFDETNMAVGKMLMGAVAQFKLLHAA